MICFSQIHKVNAGLFACKIYKVQYVLHYIVITFPYLSLSVFLNIPLSVYIQYVILSKPQLGLQSVFLWQHAILWKDNKVASLVD